MKIKIKKLGPIHDSTIDFPDITVIFGKSNEGKSYILKALYAPLSFLDRANYHELANILLSSLSTKIYETKEIKVPVEGGSFEIEVNLKDAIQKFIASVQDRLFSERPEIEFPLASDILSKIEIQSKIATIEEKKYTLTNLCPNASYSLSFSYANGKIKTSIEKYGQVADKTLCSFSLSFAIIDKIKEFVATEVFPKIIEPIGKGFGVGSVRFLSYGRSSILLLISPLATYRDVLLPNFRSTVHWILTGLNNLQIDEDIKRIFNLRVGTEGGKVKIEGYEPNHVSASLAELTTLYLSTLDGGGGLLLIEEPESQLDVYKQVSMAIILYNLAKKYRIVLTTHSEILLFTLAIISYFSRKGLRNEVKNILNEYGDLDVRDVNMSFYLTEGGKINEKNDEEILEDSALFSDINRKLFGITAKLLAMCGDKCK